MYIMNKHYKQWHIAHDSSFSIEVYNILTTNGMMDESCLVVPIGAI